MAFTVSEAAVRCGMSVHTIRFYDRQGLLPNIHRSSGGIRLFSESDLEWLGVINCLKATGMQIRQIKEFIDLSARGDEALAERLELLRAHKQEVERRMEEMREHMETINYKIWYYETAVEAGTETVHRKDRPADTPA